MPDAWDFAPPEAALGARLHGSVAALQRVLDGADVTEAADARSPGRPSRRHRRVGRCSPPTPHCRGPTSPVGVLWHAATLLREHRGDGHVAVLTAAGVAGREANVIHSAAVGAPPSS